MTIDTLALVKRYHEALNHYDAATVKAMFAPDAVYDSPGVKGRIEGRDAIIAAFDTYFAEHPDQHAVDEGLELRAPHQVWFAWKLEATAQSTGKCITRRGTEIVTFDDAGLIRHVEVHDR